MALLPLPHHSQPFTVAGTATPDPRWYEWLRIFDKHVRELSSTEVSVAWDDISGKPATFPPSSHTHPWSQVTSTPTTLGGYGITDAQPLDSDLTAIAALSTTTFGRSFLTYADEAAFKAGVNLEAGVDVASAALTLTAGAGLTGGGDLTGNRSFAVGAGTGITVNADDVAVIYGTSAGTAAQGNDSRITGAFQTSSAAALTRTDDTNVTLTLGGTPATSLVAAVSLTLGWTGQLAVGRGGSGASTLTGLLQGNGTSPFTAITNSSTVGQVLRVTAANTYAWGALDLADSDAITGDLPLANLAQGSALSVLGVAGNATADNASIAAGSDHQVLRRSGTAVGFGAVNLASSNAVTGTLPLANGGTGDTDTAWSTWTPTVSAQTGTVTGATITTTAKYKRLPGKTVAWKITCTITDKGSGSPADGVLFTTPPGLTPADTYNSASALYVNSAQGASAFISSDGKAYAWKIDGTTLWVNGTVFTMGGIYEIS